MENSMGQEWQNMTKEMHSQKAVYEQNITTLTRENQDLKRRINELTERLNRSSAEYENKVVILNQEIERLGMNLKSRAD